MGRSETFRGVPLTGYGLAGRWCAILTSMSASTSAADRPTSDFEPIEAAAEQYSVYVELTRIAQDSQNNVRPFPRFYAPAPAPLTLIPS